MDTNSKDWWQSRTIWMGILTSISGLLHAFHILPKIIDQSLISDVVTLGLGIATIIFRIKAVKEIKVPAIITPPATK